MAGKFSMGRAVLTLETEDGTFGPGLDAAQKRVGALKLGFKDAAVAIGAIGAVVAGVSAGIATLGERGAGIADVTEQFDILTKAIGGSAEAMLTNLRAATLGTVSDFDLMKTVNLGLSQGLALTAGQMGTVGDVAAVLADRVGGDAKTAFDTLIQAMATGQDKTLKTIGLNIDAAAATATYAASIGKTVAELTEADKKHAITNAILAAGQDVLAQSGKAQMDFGDQVAGSKVKLSNFVDGISQWVATSPAIGGWASVITGVSSTVTAFGLTMGPLSAGLSKLIPLLGLSGITGAMSAMASTIASTVMPLISSALPLALKALAALFTMPAGLVVAGIIGVVAIWKNWDRIAPIVEAVYTAVKTWLVDKFQAIVDSIKAKIDAVTGYFKGMYDKVVGGSYVPDLIRGIGQEFGRLDAVMVSPARAAITVATKLFNDFVAKVLDPLIAKMSKAGQQAVSVGSSVAGAVGGKVGGNTGAMIGSTASMIGGAAVTAAMGGTAAVTAAGIAGAVALGAATMGIGLAAVGAYYGLKKVFTVSADEKSARIAVGQFNESLNATATSAQKAEGAMSGWADTGLATTLVMVRDGFVAAGRSAQEAEALVGQLWASSRDGGKHTKKIIDEINAVMVVGAENAARLQAEVDATAAASATSAAEAKAAADARMADLRAGLDELTQRRDGLMKSVEKEAPERVMGSIEKGMRAEILTLDKQMAAQKQKMSVDADAMAKDLEDAFAKIKIKIPIEWKVPPLPGGGVMPIVPMAAGGIGRVTTPTLFLAGEGGPEDFAFSGGGSRFGGGSSGGVTVILEQDGRKTAEWLVPNIPGAIERLGMFRR